VFRAAGVLVPLAATRIVSTMRVGVQATDPATFVATGRLFFVIAAVAIPATGLARRAPGADCGAARVLRNER
jgi:hypothetical protein